MGAAQCPEAGRALYDSIWVYGPADFWDPLTGFEVPANVQARMVFTGFLERTCRICRVPRTGRKAIICWSPPAAAATVPS
jgi:predicted glycosyltransferase